MAWGEGAHGARRSDDFVAAQVAFGGRAGANFDRLVRQFGERRTPIGSGHDRHGPHAEPARGTDNSHRDLTAIGDQDLAEHLHPRPHPARIIEASAL